MKNWKQWTLVVIIALFGIIVGFTACDDGNGDNGKIYSITIGTLTKGSITANPTSGTKGTEITLTVNPDDLYRLKSGSLKYGSTAINEITKKFNLPAENVIVIAQFESIFIGAWGYSTNHKFTFFENTFIEQKMDTGKYTGKGTWVAETPNILIITYTHSSGESAVDTVEELTELSTPIISTGDFGFTSDTVFKYRSFTFTFIE
jgi:hypothetical protein